jgi:outer membrane protein
MKNSNVINIVLIVAVIVLYILHFTSNKGNSTASTTADGASSSLSVDGARMYWVNTDSIVDGYLLTKEKQVEIEDNNRRRSDAIRSRQTKLEADIRQYQKDAVIMTDRERGRKEEDLMRRQQELMEYQQQLTQEAMAEEQNLLVILADSVSAFFKRYTQGKNIDYVLGYQKGGGVFFANDSLDITSDALKKMNEQYQASKEKK